MKTNDARSLEPATSLDAEADDAAARVASMVEPPRARERLALATGHTASVEADDPSRLTIRSPEGQVEMSIRFTPEGPVLTFAQAAIDLHSAGDLRVACGRLEVAARDGIDLRTPGDLVQTAGGQCTIRSERRTSVEGREVGVAAHAGDVAVDATGDVDVHGSRVLLNS
jgi:hypothetical protein